MTERTAADPKNLQIESDWGARFVCVAEQEIGGKSLETLLEGKSSDMRHPDLWADSQPVGLEIW